jgi:hypothetical protein
MSTERIHSILESEGVLSSDLFCTIHAVRQERLATLYSSHPTPEPLGSWQPLSAGVVGEAVKKQTRISVTDVRRSPNYVAVYPKVRSELAVPILNGEVVTGVVNFECRHRGFFAEEPNYSIFLKLAAEIADYFAFPAQGEYAHSLLIPEASLVRPHSPDLVKVALSDLSSTLLAAISREPEIMFGLTPREFEVLVARLLADKGYTVHLTPLQKDGGYDIMARVDLPTGPVLTLVECKKWAPDRPVTIEVVRNLYGVLAAENATNAMIATTSRFTKDALGLQDTLKYRMQLNDFNEVSRWLRPYFLFV